MVKKSIMVLALLFIGVFLFFYFLNSGVRAKNESSNKHDMAQLRKEKESQKEIKQENDKKKVEEEAQDKKVIYLTFDDGPSKYTQEVLNILKQENIKATFFVIGPHAEQFPSLIKSEKQYGHYVGLHSMTHDYKKIYTKGNFLSEMKQVQQILQRIIHGNPILCRPPYGSKPGLTQDLRNQVAEAGLKIWDWTIDSLDWKYNKVPLEQSVPKIVENVVSQANKDKEIILMHDIHPQSVKALPEIIKQLKGKGYIFKTYSESEHMSLNFWHDNRL
ncbi:peptidoglycan-N-acetylglucosamine deacetylase [Bacillus thuringiensis serovar brasilensis]|uniref:polysaccharide deacetylase family protein n=1 Tax=Bacillus cereus group TaxID=86661 RepID=UPI000A3A1B04|nr:polysaccharide deacetylase family protein [Bacillus thuringiensis]MCU5032192.1 polysaccharide deacetylase [Bacillus cereus]MRA75328.1 polysaccharide deacetylase family protein [Bacillus thuringiensis]MRA93817.1 polysaccharide deacetylase family protein [Bacillus thuringiensis]MRC56539.1 polysaccharide deacetylase family protein [Bacillus thuringiensis]OTX35818.1 peptidoglycan-N-acetylglucosamine deacetylase [Bacillus thuringiensis serovar brasilensis]